MSSKGRVIIKVGEQFYAIPDDKLAEFQIPLSEIIPAILKEVGAPADLKDSELEEKLASWTNPVIAFIPDTEKEDEKT